MAPKLVPVVFAVLAPLLSNTLTTEQQIQSLQSTVATLTRQLMLQQFYQDEKLRSEGNSGVKRIRMHDQGTQPFHATTYTMHSMASAHDHANHQRTIGLGELVGVLNGWEFRTRHNDYLLNMPSVNSTEYHATDEIPFPDVPPEVLQYSTIEDQITEMREWFKAWRDQDYSVRDYRRYFKPVLCYLEGAWTLPDEDIEESFDSDRHYLDASTWHELLDKVRFMAQTGRKDADENFAYLPATVFDHVDGYPLFAQWNYRILCHPLSRDLPLNRLRPVNDLGVRMTYKRDLEEHAWKRSARFQLNPHDTDTFVDGRVNYGLLDELMAEIPGKENYPGYLEDDVFREKAYNYVEDIQNGTKVDVPLNAAYYHRWYKSVKKGAMGLKYRRRSFSDETLFMAMTTNPNVAYSKTKHCNKKGKVCKQYEQRWSYAIPMEIIYLNPLQRWNPFDIPYRGNSYSPEGRAVTAGRRKGRLTLGNAYNGTNHRFYYRTPANFYTSNEVDVDPADTALLRDVGVLNRNGDLCRVRASGVRIFMPEIPGVGVLRTRFPIMPIHGEGDIVWKELAALKDALLDPDSHDFMFPESHPFYQEDPQSIIDRTNSSDGSLHLLVGASTPEPTGGHTHFVDLSASEAALLMNSTITVVTSASAGHTHSLELTCQRVYEGQCIRILMSHCDDRRRCLDNHPRWLSIVGAQQEEEASTASFNWITVVSNIRRTKSQNLNASRLIL